MNQLTKTFDNTPIRIATIEGQKHMAAVDVCKALGYKNPSDAWKDLKRRNKQELKQYSQGCKLHGRDGRPRLTDVLPLKGVIRLCMLASTPKAERFRDWATDVLANEIQNREVPSRLIQDLNIDEIIIRTDKVKTALSKIENIYGNLSNNQKRGYTHFLMTSAGLPVPTVELEWEDVKEGLKILEN